MLTALGGSGATPANGLQAEVLVVNSFDELRQLPAAAVKGKILLFNEKFDKQLAANGDGGSAYGKAVVYRGAGPTLGKSLGAAAVLVRSVGGADYRLPHTGATFVDGDGPQIPSGAVTAEDADLLANLTHQGPVTMHLTLTPQTLPKVESYNVIADWKGTEHPEQFVIVSGHLDSWDLGHRRNRRRRRRRGFHASHSPAEAARAFVRAAPCASSPGWTKNRAPKAAATTPSPTPTTSPITSPPSNPTWAPAIPPGSSCVGKPALEEWMRPVAHVLDAIGAGVIKHSEEAGADVDAMNQKGVPGFAPIQDGRFYFNYHHTPPTPSTKSIRANSAKTPR